MKLLTQVRVGRGAQCEIQLDHDTVSRLHAILHLRGDGSVRLVDQGSSNGVFLRQGGRWSRIYDATVEAGQAVRFGEEEAILGELLRSLSAPALLEAAEDVELKPDLPVERHRQPRRNPRTGDIEETP